jgi:hypothetical protein
MKKQQDVATGTRTYRPRLDSEDETKVKYLHQQGLNPRQISFIVERSLTSVYKILRIKGDGPVKPKVLREEDIDPMERTPRSE